MIFEYLRIAGQMLRAHKFRSLLTVTSITIGAFSIVLMSSLGSSGSTTLFRSMEELGGARLIAVEPKVPERAEAKLANYTHGITVADRDLLFASLPHVLERSMFAITGRRDAVGDSGVTARTDLVGGDGGFLSLFRMKLAKGRGFTEEENRARAKVCVVGHKLAERMWGGDSLGRWLLIDGVRCHVIGQLADQERWGVNFGFDWRDVAVLPLATIGDVDPFVAASTSILVKTDEVASNTIVKRIVNALLVERHHNVDDFEIFDFSSFLDKFEGMFAVMNVIVGFIAGIALLVGGVGVMNMMLVSVSERVREIGIRKALGASPVDIGAQFLCEAIVLSGSGGLVGTAGGIGAAVLVGMLIRSAKPMWVAVISENAVIAALSVSLAIGVLFGFFPARRAARLDAITAIRR